jgi:hypothetical protein
MKVKEIRFDVRATINMGSYESLVFEYGEVLDVSDEPDVSEIRRRLRHRCKAVVEQEIAAARADVKKVDKR